MEGKQNLGHFKEVPTGPFAALKDHAPCWGRGTSCGPARTDYSAVPTEVEGHRRRRGHGWWVSVSKGNITGLLRIPSAGEGKRGLEGRGWEGWNPRERFSFHWKCPCALDFISALDLSVLEAEGGFL